MRKNPHDIILKNKPKKQYLSTVFKSCHNLNCKRRKRIITWHSIILVKSFFILMARHLFPCDASKFKGSLFPKQNTNINIAEGLAISFIMRHNFFLLDLFSIEQSKFLDAMLVIIMSFNISVHRKVQMVGIFQRGLCVPLIVAYNVFFKKKK